jgi:hypothetical protein
MPLSGPSWFVSRKGDFARLRVVTGAQRRCESVPSGDFCRERGSHRAPAGDLAPGGGPAGLERVGREARETGMSRAGLNSRVDRRRRWAVTVEHPACDDARGAECRGSSRLRSLRLTLCDLDGP